jgi:membrane protease YdiL (CAAX protease family)
MLQEAAPNAVRRARAKLPGRKDNRKWHACCSRTAIQKLGSEIFVQPDLNFASPGGSRAAFAVALFAVAVVAIEIVLILTMNAVGPGSPWATPLMIGVMWTPAIVGMAVQLASERSLRGFGWGLGPWQFYGYAYLMPLLYGGLSLVAAQALGAGTIDFGNWAVMAGRWGLPEHVLVGLLMQLTLFMIPGLVMGIGEEIGWRGFLAPKLSRFMGFWGVVNVTYVLWLAFHLPGMFLGGYHGNGTPLWYSLICFSALLYPGTIFMNWLRMRSGSLWPCAFYHAAHNVFIQVLWNFAFKPNEAGPWLLGEFGALLPVIFAVLLAGLLWKLGIQPSEARGEKTAAAPAAPLAAAAA